MRTPLLLVPGWSDRAAHMHWLQRAFIAAGWPVTHVHALDFADRFGSNIAHAGEIADAISLLLNRTGAARVDVVAHSMGGLALRYYLHHHDGARRVRRAVFTATPHRGTWAAYVAWGAGAREMRPDSAFLVALNELPVVPPGITCLALQTPTEARILPRHSALLTPGRNLRVWCHSHAGLLRSKRAFTAIRAFLEE